MIKEAIDRILELAAPARLDVLGRTFITHDMAEVEAQAPANWWPEIQTLSGLFERAATLCGISSAPNSALVITVRAHKVLLHGPARLNGKVPLLAEACASDATDAFTGNWQDLEVFVLGLLTRFHESAERDTLIKLLSAICDSQSITTEDDGISQQVTVKRGVVAKAQATASPFHDLLPVATFPEIPAIPRKYLLRLKGGADGVRACLFRCSGDRWEDKARDANFEWLKKELTALPVGAVSLLR